MKGKTIALLAAAGCAVYLLTRKRNEPDGTPQDSTKGINPVFVAEVVNYQKGDAVLYNGKSGYSIATATHPFYTLIGPDLKKVTVSYKELQPA